MEELRLRLPHKAPEIETADNMIAGNPASLPELKLSIMSDLSEIRVVRNVPQPRPSSLPFKNVFKKFMTLK